MKRDFYADMPEDLVIFDRADLMEIESTCIGLEEDEVLGFYGFTYKELKEEFPLDYRWFTRCYRRGQSAGLFKVMGKLVSSMSDKNGHQPAMAFLSRFAGEKWPIDAGDTLSEGKFSFQVLRNK